jgi:hypothetical protein
LMPKRMKCATRTMKSSRSMATRLFRQKPERQRLRRSKPRPRPTRAPTLSARRANRVRSLPLPDPPLFPASTAPQVHTSTSSDLLAQTWRHLAETRSPKSVRWRSMAVDGGTMRVPFHAEMTIVSAELHSTTEKGVRAEREWESLPARIEAGVVLAEVVGVSPSSRESRRSSRFRAGRRVKSNRSV